MDPKELLQNPEQIKNLINLLQALLPESTKSEKIKEKRKPVRKSTKKQEDNIEIGNSKIKNRLGRKIISTNNKFETMSEFSLHKEDSKIDRKLCKNPPVARSREFEPVVVVCRACGEKDSVSPSLIYNESTYKCNSCCSGKGKK